MAEQRTMKVLDRSGHKTLTWDPTDVGTQDEVRAKFEEMVQGQHFLAYTLDANKEKGEVIREFDPEADIVLAPQNQGG